MLHQSPSRVGLNHQIDRRNDDQASVMSEAIEKIRSSGGAALTEAGKAFKKGPSPFSTKDVTGKGHDTLQKIFEARANAESDIFDKMTHEKAKNEGKRLFADLVNKSDAAALHPVEKDPAI